MEWTQGWPMFYNVWIRETYDLSTVILTNCYYCNAPEGFWLCKWLVFIAVTRCKFGTFWSPQNRFLLENQNIPKNPQFEFLSFTLCVKPSLWRFELYVTSIWHLNVVAESFVIRADFLTSLMDYLKFAFSRLSYVNIKWHIFK